jgi:titin
MSSPIRRIATRVALIAAFCQLIATACEPTAAVDPTDGKNLLVPDASLTAGISIFTASTVSWSEVDLSWPTSPSVSGYQVFRSASGPAGGYNLIATTAANVGNYADKGLTAATQYCYEIRSFKYAGRNINYSAYSTAVCATTLPPPVLAPSETDAVPQGFSFHIHWKDNSANESGFHIEQAPTPNGGWVRAVDAVANATSADVYADHVEQQACFRVIAYSTVGDSFASVPDCTTAPAPPSQLSANAPDPQSISLSWTDNSSVEDGFRVYRMEQGGAWADIATLPANVVTFRDAAVRADVPYTYHVQALKDGGYSNFSNNAVGVIPTTRPAAPTNAEAFYMFDGYINTFTFEVGWSDNSNNEQGFRIESTDGLGGWYPFGETPANESFFTYAFPGWLDPGQICVRIVAFNALGDSSPSNESCADTIGFPGFGYGIISGASPPTLPRVKQASPKARLSTRNPRSR